MVLQKSLVQSLHIIPGEEFENLKKTVCSIQSNPKECKENRTGENRYLYHHEDIVEVCKALQSVFPAERKATDAVVLMGHGTSHESNIYYPGLQYYLWQQSPLIFLGTVEGYPGLEEIISMLKEKKRPGPFG